MNRDIHIPQSEIDAALYTCEQIRKSFTGERFCFVESYGCQMNDHDAERLTGMLAMMGYTLTDDKSKADFIIFNTCAVREHAEKRVMGNLGALKKLKDEKPELKIGVCGCMMQQKEVSDRVYKRFPFVDMVFGTNELHLFPQMFEKILCGERVKQVRDIAGEIPEGLPAVRKIPFSTNVIVMYGCNNFCTYCIVPYVRGRERAREPQDILRECRELAQAGYREITLIGQNVNSYRADDGSDFSDILAMVNDIDGLERIRFMTSHPKDLSDRLIDAMANLDKVCNHIHLPVQSGSNRILSLMNRKYTREHYLELVHKLRDKVPGVEITTDIIVGFPTETEEDFRDTVSLVEEVGYAAAYTFMYSRRPGTKAAVMDGQVSEDEKKRRLHELNDVCARLLREQNKKYIGTVGEVLTEGVDERQTVMAYGKLPGFKMVYFEGDHELIGQKVKVKIKDAQNNSLIGERIE
ncbi:MAG: tRNA (N6-isopentenyl adenosine(37)-C2)-methylthiotransferase MiaB [Clostridia bacterium]|nr:tRNA (N6-isopentenyl adenosine(37)-C2)-methylthiotransferase MiaB [Clostridia bacterium]